MFRAVLIGSLIIVAFASDQIEVNQVPALDGRIVGGTAASIYDFPHQISMRYYGQHRCGGSIYSANIIVSASHCVINVNVKAMTIVAGSSRLSEPQVELPVKKIIMHPNFKTTNQDYDVALLILGGLLPFRDGIQPIPLAKTRPEDDTLVTVTGWGYLMEGAGMVPNQLQKVDVNIVGLKECRKVYTRLYITNRMVCAAVTGGGKDACQGDSGGPLIVENELLGIVSWGVGCARSEYPGVYASVPDLYEWIEATAANHVIEFA